MTFLAQLFWKSFKLKSGKIYDNAWKAVLKEKKKVKKSRKYENACKSLWYLGAVQSKETKVSTPYQLGNPQPILEAKIRGGRNHKLQESVAIIIFSPPWQLFERIFFCIIWRCWFASRSFVSVLVLVFLSFFKNLWI